MVKIFDENVFCKVFIIDNKSGLGHHVVAPDFCVLEVPSSKHLVGFEEANLSRHGLLGVLTAEGEGGLRVGNPSFLELIPIASDPAVDIEQEEGKKQDDLNPHVLLLIVSSQPLYSRDAFCLLRLVWRGCVKYVSARAKTHKLTG